MPDSTLSINSLLAELVKYVAVTRLGPPINLWFHYTTTYHDVNRRKEISRKRNHASVRIINAVLPKYRSYPCFFSGVFCSLVRSLLTKVIAYFPERLYLIWTII